MSEHSCLLDISHSSDNIFCLRRQVKSLEVKSKILKQRNSIFLVSETQFEDVIHSLDVWHKSKSIKKCLAKVCIELIVPFHTLEQSKFDMFFLLFFVYLQVG